MSQWLPVDEIASQVSRGKLKAVDLVKRSLKTIAEKAEYQAIIATLDENALMRAKQIDKQVSEGQNPGPLAGVPFIAKDNFLVFGAETTAASNILKGFIAPYQSTVINRLEAAGAICVAKANLDAFGHGASTENSDFFTTKNPHDKTRVPGGSSGGSAAAVVLDMAPFALGTDTGGSSRQPASFTGCVGFKPTYGLMSRSGIVAMASSTDTVGVLAKNVSDVAYVVDVMAGKDELDSTTIERDTKSYAMLDLRKIPASSELFRPTKTDFSVVDVPSGTPPPDKIGFNSLESSSDRNEVLRKPSLSDTATIKGKKIGVIKEYMADGLDPGVRKQIEDSIKKMKEAGAVIKEVSLPSLPLSLAVYYIVVPAEVSSNLSRYDGQRYGYTYKDAKTLDESFNKSRSIGFGKEAKRRIMIGTYVLSSGYYDAYYKKAQTVRTKLVYEFAKAFENVDFLVGPTAPTTAFKIGENANDPMQMYLADVMTVGASLVGVPSIIIPAGKADSLPVGLQIIGPQKSDRELFAVANAAEGLTK